MAYHRKLTALSVLSAVVALVTVLATGASADWFDGDGHKMHFPQLPDPQGWDIKAGFDIQTGLTKVLADDWKCSQTGPVSDVHLWGSFRRDDGDPELIDRIHLSIHDDVPAGTDPNPNIFWSHPGNLLWEADFSATEISIIDPYGEGPQGWFNPNTNEFVPEDHVRYHQINIENIPDPFIQEEGTIYWLDVVVDLAAPGTNVEWGWKTSRDHFNDDAVWGDYDATGNVTFWNELRDPFTDESLDLAFVINIPEPASGLLMLLGLGAIVTTRRTACWRRSRVVAFTALILIAASGPFAKAVRAAFIGDIITVVASNEQGSAESRVPSPFSDLPEQVRWMLEERFDLVTEDGTLIGTIDDLTVELIADPVASISFTATAGSADTTFSLSSATVGFPALTNPHASAEAELTLTDIGSDGMSVSVVSPPNSGLFKSVYNGSSGFTELLSTISIAGGSTTVMGNSSGTISGSVSSIQAVWTFKLSANDQVSGIGSFVVVPEPTTLTLVGLGLSLITLRRRR